jgi:hypothetical protein
MRIGQSWIVRNLMTDHEELQIKLEKIKSLLLEYNVTKDEKVLDEINKLVLE